MRAVSRDPQRRSDPHMQVKAAMAGPTQIGDSLCMTLSPHDLPDDAETLKAMILTARAENARLDAERERLKQEGQLLSAEVERLTARAERLDHIVSVLRRAQFGRRSERISEDQIELALEDVETQHGTEDAAAEKSRDIIRSEATKARRANRGHLPAHLPRKEIVIEPEAKACPCCGGALHVIGEDVSERLDKIPARLRGAIPQSRIFASLYFCEVPQRLTHLAPFASAVSSSEGLSLFPPDARDKVAPLTICVSHKFCCGTSSGHSSARSPTEAVSALRRRDFPIRALATFGIRLPMRCWRHHS
jgi:Transposase C of IS166 homeodomain/zinc-finger binding domain of transposase IS66